MPILHGQGQNLQYPGAAPTPMVNQPSPYAFLQQNSVPNAAVPPMPQQHGNPVQDQNF